jgi:hypothetical protein
MSYPAYSMRFDGRLGAALALTWTACSSAAPVRQSEPAAIASAPAAPPPQSSTGSEGATAPGAKLSAVDAWQWLRKTLPKETAKLRLDESSATLEKLLALAPGQAAATFFDRSCQPLKLTRHERTLAGDVNESTSIEGRRKTVHRDGIAFGFDITVVCGSDTIYEHEASGAWVEKGGSATGCAHSFGHYLSDVRDGQIWYGAEQATLTVGCAARYAQDQRCTDGTTRTCARCTEASIDVKRMRSFTRTHATSAGVRERPNAAVDCSVPCPADELGPMIEAANAALADAAFEEIGNERHPTLFSDRAACTAYRQKHPITKDQLVIW